MSEVIQTRHMQGLRVHGLPKLRLAGQWIEPPATPATSATSGAVHRIECTGVHRM